MITGLQRAGVKRVLFVGGAGSLEVSHRASSSSISPDSRRRTRPKRWRDARRSECGARRRSGLDWTFLSPAAEIAPGERTGRYRTDGDQFLVDAAGKSFITFEDYAVAVLDELERPRHVGQRFGVAY
jgi:putative NADH-flavin reductase